MDFPTKNDHFGVFGGTIILRKHPYRHATILRIEIKPCESAKNSQRKTADDAMSHHRMAHDVWYPAWLVCAVRLTLQLLQSLALFLDSERLGVSDFCGVKRVPNFPSPKKIYPFFSQKPICSMYIWYVFTLHLPEKSIIHVGKSWKIYQSHGWYGYSSEDTTFTIKINGIHVGNYAFLPINPDPTGCSSSLVDWSSM